MDSIELELSNSIKSDLIKNLNQITLDIQQIMGKIEHKGCCILNEFEQVHRVFSDLHMTAGSYYLNAYLSPFTDQFNEISTAVQHLSERNHGAIIAIERNDSLDSLIHSGTHINATLSCPLLESIFYPGSPLHDGAVLVKKNNLVSAGNVLPLSRAYTGKQKLGTRHRAAIGLSEISDALVLIVSEETGRISFSFKGELFPVHPGGLV
ncbi:sporulation-specific diadenylate cyclase CdaS [Risungbinella massiliensis]|uniref:sporulation-specific diadenylate cyclase CdaS n=1 Tax=Risungbinella massiliensis TaxID=1329796 RepID=UPI0005CC5FD6|nr:sporulation-specific diadenylate cyclase CdaS [Risungbinella massiliensis]